MVADGRTLPLLGPPVRAPCTTESTARQDRAHGLPWGLGPSPQCEPLQTLRAPLDKGEDSQGKGRWSCPHKDEIVIHLCKPAEPTAPSETQWELCTLGEGGTSVQAHLL